MGSLAETGAFATRRLDLRPLTSEPVDAELLFDLNRDPEVMRYITGRPSTRGEVETEVASSIGSRWLAFERDSGAFVGWIAVRSSDDPRDYEVGWRLRRTAWGRGFASEGARALIDLAFESGATRVYAQTMAVNERSRRVMERCGLTYCRTFHLDFEDPLPGTELGEVEYELTRERATTASRTPRRGTRCRM